MVSKIWMIKISFSKFFLVFPLAERNISRIVVTFPVEKLGDNSTVARLDAPKNILAI